jgi:hypothetical protein
MRNKRYHIANSPKNTRRKADERWQQSQKNRSYRLKNEFVAYEHIHAQSIYGHYSTH